MSDFKYDEDSVKALIEWATTTQFPKEIRLTEAEHITDVALFVQTNIYDIEEHYPDPVYFPAITRIYRIREWMESRN